MLCNSGGVFLILCLCCYVYRTNPVTAHFVCTDIHKFPPSFVSSKQLRSPRPEACPTTAGPVKFLAQDRISWGPTVCMAMGEPRLSP